MLLSMPHIDISALIIPGSHSAIVTPFPSTGYTQTDLYMKSLTTSIVIPTSPAAPSTVELTPCSETRM